MAMCRVMLFSPLGSGTGNRTTVLRIKDELESGNIQCFLLNPSKLSASKPVQYYVDTHQITLIIAIHAYKTGQYLLKVETPLILILGGTDVNEAYKDPHQMEVMTQVVFKSRHIVAFSESVCQQFSLLWPTYNAENIAVIPQGVSTCCSDFSLQKYFSKLPEEGPSSSKERSTFQACGLDLDILHGQLREGQARLFTIVGSIRAIKNPLFILEQFTDWRSKKQATNCWLLFVGVNQNDDYFKQFYSAVQRNAGTVYIPGLSMVDTHAVIRESFAVVNTSDSEGMAIAILEAMCLQTPVIVRDIPANTAIVRNGWSGLVFKTAEEFLEIAERLLQSAEKVAFLRKNASAYVSEFHSIKKEAESYLSLVNRFSAPTHPVPDAGIQLQ